MEVATRLMPVSITGDGTCQLIVAVTTVVKTSAFGRAQAMEVMDLCGCNQLKHIGDNGL